MEILSNQAVAVVLLCTVIGLGVWFFAQLYSWVRSLTKDVTDLTKIVAVLGEKVKNNEDDILALQNDRGGRATVKYKRGG